MKRLAILFLCVPLMLAGCAKATSTPPPLAPGYANQADQTMGETLAAANGFYHSIQCQTRALGWDIPSKSCVPVSQVTEPMVLSATEKQAFNTFSASINVANAVYTSFHAGTATQEAAQLAIDKVQAQQNALQAQIQVAK